MIILGWQTDRLPTRNLRASAIPCCLMWHGTQLDAGLVVHREAIHEVRASLVVADHLYIRAGASQARDDFVQRPHAGTVPKVRRRYVDAAGSPRFCVNGPGAAVRSAEHTSALQ